VEADLFYIDRHIDIIMLVAFHIFANTACVKIVWKNLNKDQMLGRQKVCSTILDRTE